MFKRYKPAVILVVLLLACLWLAPRASAQTNVTGDITANTTWTAAAGPYVVTGDVNVLSGVTLTIETGVTVKFNLDRSLIVAGTLVADGVTFTSNEATPAAGNWRQIRITDSGTGQLSNSTIQYAGNASRFALEVGANGGTNTATAVVTSLNILDTPRGVLVYDSLNATDLALSNITTTGLQVPINGRAAVTGSDLATSSTTLQVQGRLSVTSTTVSGNRGLELEQGAKVTLDGVTMTAVDWPIRYAATADLTFNGTNTITSSGGKSGILIQFGSTAYNFTLDTAPIPYYFWGSMTVSATDTMTVASNNILKFQGGQLHVRGALNAVASVGETIYFTSYRNDNLGGDTNDDGTATAPGVGDWGGILFYDESIDAASELRRGDVSYATRSVEMQNASPTISENLFRLNQHGAWMQGTSNPTFTQNTIATSQVTPIALSWEASPVFSNNTFSFSNNQFDAIGLIGGTLTADATLIQRDVTDIPNVTYYLLDNVTIPAGKTLTIEEGIVIKASNSRGIYVEGTLVADATDGNEIIFTSVKDDNYGNPKDTNRDGNTSTPARNDWYGIYFTHTATASIIDEAVLQYATNHSSRYYGDQSYTLYGAINVLNSSPTISNVLIKDVNIGIAMARDAKPVISDVEFANTASVPVELSMASDPTFTNITLTNVALQALGLRSETLGLSGTIRKRSFAGYSNITYVLMGDVTIASGANVTVEPEIVIKGQGGADIFVDGGFKADASQGTEIIFTSLADDNRGMPGDTNGDGNATAPAPGNWGTIQFRATSDDIFSLLDNIVVRYGQAGSIFSDAGTVVDSILVTDAAHWGFAVTGAAAPLISNTTIQNSARDPILMSVHSNPTFTNISFVANGSQGLALLEGTYAGYWYAPLGGYFPNDQVLASNATLSKRDVAGIQNIAYVISSNMTIGSSAKFTIDPGVVIKGNGGRIFVDGALSAQGTDIERIVFTAYADDSSGGDTNNNGNATEPGRNAWYGFEFRQSAMQAQNVLSKVDVRYAGTGQGAIHINNAYALIENSVIEQTNGSAFVIFGDASPLIRSNQILNVSSTPVYMALFSNPTFENNTAANVGIMGLMIHPETYSTTATVPKRSFGGYDNITYVLTSNEYKINNGTTLTIPAGVVFKTEPGWWQGGGYFTVEGGLKVEGTATEPVVFTNLEDDRYGNPSDSQLNGNVPTNSRMGGGWFRYIATSDDANSIIDYAILHKREYGLTMTSAAPTVRNTKFENLDWGLLLNGVSAPIVENNSFDNLAYSPLLISLVSYPGSTTGNTISGKTFEAIGVIGETLVQDVTLPRRTFAGRAGIPYYFPSGYTIGTGATLTIAPGNVLKFGNSYGMSVRKGLVAEGTADPDSVIVFTHIYDDFYGGDTNSDSTTTSVGSYNRWPGIHYQDESLDNLSKLDYVVVRYANQGGVKAINASPTITNSVLRDNNIGLWAVGASNPVVTGTDIYDNGEFGVKNEGTFTIDATNNWWGDNTGPKHATNAGGLGDVVSDKVTFSPFVGGGAGNPILGDPTLNGDVSALDASRVLQHVVGTAVLTGNALAVADVSGNGSVSAMDASYILQHVVGALQAFPAEAAGKTEQVPVVAVSDVKLKVESVSAELGQKVVVPVRIDEVGNLYALQFELKYDKDLLTLDEVRSGALAAERSLLWQKDEEGGLRVALAGSDALAESGVIAELVFTVGSESKGTQDVNLTVQQFVANERDLTASAVSGKLTVDGLPTEYALGQNFPNPFSTSTTIEYATPDADVLVDVKVFNILGQVVATLVHQNMPAGKHKVIWDGRNDAGQAVVPGVYLYRIEAGDFVATRKMLLVR